LFIKDNYFLGAWKIAIFDKKWLLAYKDGLGCTWMFFCLTGKFIGKCLSLRLWGMSFGSIE